MPEWVRWVRYGFVVSIEGLLVGCLVLLVYWLCWSCVCFVLCLLSPFWPRIFFDFLSLSRFFLQSGIALFDIFLSIKFNSINTTQAH